MATHNLELVRRSPYRVIEINRGQIVYDSTDSVDSSAPVSSPQPSN